jgi:hypothetical protein
MLLADTCLRLKHYPAFLKSSRTIVLRKPRKSSYESLSVWRLIALLKTISKVVKKLLARRIRNLAKEHYLLHPSQIGAQAERGTGTALELLTSIVQTVWKKGKDQVASLLSLNISGAFLTVNHTCLVVTIRKLGFSSYSQTASNMVKKIDSKKVEIFFYQKLRFII